MSSLLYLLRGPEHTMAHALYVSGDAHTDVIGIEDALPTKLSSRSAEVIHSVSTNLSVGQGLAYPELLELVIKAGKIITL